MAKVTTAGDMVYATGANALARLAKGAQGTVLQMGASLPAWGNITAAVLNTGVNNVAASEFTTSTSYANLATDGPSVTVYCPSGAALVLWFCIVANASINQRAICGIRIDSTDPIAAWETQWDNADDGTAPNASLLGMFLTTGQSVANHVFKMRYKTTGGTQYFGERRLVVIGL